MTRYKKDIGKSLLGRSTSAALAMLLLSACQSEPTGQVAAVVDGEEVTLAEINAELANMRVPENADKKAMQKLALQRVVERKLLANSAKQDGISETPEFIIRRQQLEDALLVQMLTQKVARTVKVPADSDVDKFMADNPNMFASRSILIVDQIRFATPARDDFMKPLAAAKTMAAVTSALDQLGVKYERQNSEIDTAQLPGEMVNKIRAVPAGEPFVVPADGFITVSLITGQRPAVLPAANARPAAVAATRNKTLSDLLQKRLTSEREQAAIKYQPGFEPANGKTPAAGAGKAKTGG